MEKDFQTSFIPKRPMIEERATASRPISFFVILAFLILSIMLIATSGLYFYNDKLKGDVIKMDASLILAKNRFEPTKIVQLQLLDKRLKAATDILSKHTVISPIFESLQALTMKSVRFTKFSYSLITVKNVNTMDVKMSGIAVGYRSVALQYDLFVKNKFFIDPIFSNLSLDNSGNVIFDLEFSVDPSFLDYKQMLLTDSTQSSGGAQ